MRQMVAEGVLLDMRPRVNPALRRFYEKKMLADAFADSLVKMSVDQLQGLVVQLQQQIAGIQGTMAYASSQYSYNHFGGQTPEQFNNYMANQANNLSTAQQQLQEVLAFLGPNAAYINQPIDKKSLVDRYGNQPVDEGQDTQEYGRGALACNASGPDPLRDMLSEFVRVRRKEREQELEGFFDSVGKVFKNVVGYAFAPFTLGASLALTSSPFARQFGSFSPWSALMPAGLRQRVYNLTPQQAAQAETIAKVERGIGAAVAVAVGAYAALPAAGAAGAAGSGAGAAGAAGGATGAVGASAASGAVSASTGLTAAQVAAGASVLTATGNVARNFFPQSSPSDLNLAPIPQPGYTGVLSSQTSAQNPFSTSSELTPVGSQEAANANNPVLAESLNGIKTGVTAAKDLTHSVLSTVMGALNTTTAIFKARNDLIMAIQGPSGEIKTMTYNAAQIPGASGLKDGYAYPGFSGGGGGGGGLPATMAGDGSGESALLPSAGSPLDLSGIGMGPGVSGNTGPQAPGVQMQSKLPEVVAVLTMAGAAYFYFNPKARKKAVSMVKSAAEGITGKVQSWTHA